jgi:hypothetical protein
MSVKGKLYFSFYKTAEKDKTLIFPYIQALYIKGNAHL